MKKLFFLLFLLCGCNGPKASLEQRVERQSNIYEKYRVSSYVWIRHQLDSTIEDLITQDEVAKSDVDDVLENQRNSLSDSYARAKTFCEAKRQ